MNIMFGNVYMQNKMYVNWQVNLLLAVIFDVGKKTILF